MVDLSPILKQNKKDKSKKKKKSVSVKCIL